MAIKRKPQSVYQHDPLVIPSKWAGEERQFGLRLSQLIDQLFARKTTDPNTRCETAADSDKLGGVPAAEYALKTDTAPDSALFGGKAPEYYLQPRNLLDNSDFSNLLAQAGLLGTHGTATYLADRWIAIRCTATQNDGYVAATASASTGGFEQKVAGCSGKTVTFAAKVKSYGPVRLALITYDTSGAFFAIDAKENAGEYILICTATIPADEELITAKIYPGSGSNGGSADIYWAALYEGAYTAETLPPYVPKSYAVELAECQRYYRSENVTALHNAYLAAANRAYFSIPTNIKMRLPKPTANYIDATNGGLYQGTTAAITINSSNSTLTVAAMGNSEIRLILTLNEDTSLSLFREAMVRIPPFELVADL